MNHTPMKSEKEQAHRYIDNMAQSNAIENNPLPREAIQHMHSMVERGLTSDEAYIEILQKFAPHLLKQAQTTQ